MPIQGRQQPCQEMYAVRNQSNAAWNQEATAVPWRIVLSYKVTEQRAAESEGMMHVDQDSQQMQKAKCLELQVLEPRDVLIR